MFNPRSCSSFSLLSSASFFVLVILVLRETNTLENYSTHFQTTFDPWRLGDVFSGNGGYKI